MNAPPEGLRKILGTLEELGIKEIPVGLLEPQSDGSLNLEKLSEWVSQKINENLDPDASLEVDFELEDEDDEFELKSVEEKKVNLLGGTATDIDLSPPSLPMGASLGGSLVLGGSEILDDLPDPESVIEIEEDPNPEGEDKTSNTSAPSLKDPRLEIRPESITLGEIGANIGKATVEKNPLLLNYVTVALGEMGLNLSNAEHREKSFSREEQEQFLNAILEQISLPERKTFFTLLRDFKGKHENTHISDYVDKHFKTQMRNLLFCRSKEPLMLETARKGDGSTILRVLGKGSMGWAGVVYDRSIKDPAHRVHLAKVSNDPAGALTFENEAQIMGELRGIPGVPELIGTEQLPNGDQVLRMEYKPGPATLGSLLKNTPEGRLATDLAVDVARQLAVIMREVNAKGIHYHDAKPENAIIDGDGFVSAIDFGLASNEERDRTAEVVGSLEDGDDIEAALDSFISKRGLKGTPVYMSYVQMFGDETGSKCDDTFGMVAILVELLTGRKIADYSDFVSAQPELWKKINGKNADEDEFRHALSRYAYSLKHHVESDKPFYDFEAIATDLAPALGMDVEATKATQLFQTLKKYALSGKALPMAELVQDLEAIQSQELPLEMSLAAHVKDNPALIKSQEADGLLEKAPKLRHNIKVWRVVSGIAASIAGIISVGVPAYGFYMDQQQQIANAKSENEREAALKIQREKEAERRRQIELAQKYPPNVEVEFSLDIEDPETGEQLKVPRKIRLPYHNEKSGVNNLLLKLNHNFNSGQVFLNSGKAKSLRFFELEEDLDVNESSNLISYLKSQGFDYKEQATSAFYRPWLAVSGDGRTKLLIFGITAAGFFDESYSHKDVKSPFNLSQDGAKSTFSLDLSNTNITDDVSLYDQRINFLQKALDPESYPTDEYQVMRALKLVPMNSLINDESQREEQESLIADRKNLLDKFRKSYFKYALKSSKKALEAAQAHQLAAQEKANDAIKSAQSESQKSSTQPVSAESRKKPNYDEVSQKGKSFPKGNGQQNSFAAMKTRSPRYNPQVNSSRRNQNRRGR